MSFSVHSLRNSSFKINFSGLSSNNGCLKSSTTDLSVQAPIAMIRKVRSNDRSQSGYGLSAGEQENMTSSAENSQPVTSCMKIPLVFHPTQWSHCYLRRPGKQISVLKVRIIRKRNGEHEIFISQRHEQRRKYNFLILKSYFPDLTVETVRCQRDS